MKYNNIEVIDTASFSFAKNKNKKNDDSILSPKYLGDGLLMAIADGVGSYNGAKEASKIAIKYLDKIENPTELIDMQNVFDGIQNEISMLTDKNIDFNKSATTLSFCFLNEDGLYIGHIGDCRLYLKINNKLKQITKDHTRYQEQLDQGIFTKKQLLPDSYKTKRMLTTAISAVTIMEFNEIFIPLKDLPIVDNIISIYLMSDGSHSFWDKRPKFSDNTMNKICNFSASLRNRIERIKPEDDYSLVAASIKFNDINFIDINQ